METLGQWLIRAVRILLLHPKINDTIRDDSGRTALEAASSSEVAQVIEGGWRVICNKNVC
jgi:hypothetical protein